MNSPIPQGFELQEKISTLQSAILDKHPTLPSLLQTIHRTLKQYPENVTLLSESEIQIIVSGLEHQTGTHLAESVQKTAKKPGGVAKLKSLGSDAF